MAVGPGDPGLQAERTALAWQRTGVSGSAVGGLALLVAAHLERWLLVGVVGVLAAAAALLAGLATHTRPAPSPWGRLTATAAVPGLLAVAGALVAMAPRT